MKGIEGSTLGRYELRRRVAQGGMSEVYLGYDRRVKRRVAIKVLYGSSEPFIRRFEREVLAVGTLSHDHILPLYDYGEQRPWYYLVMPYIEGGTLRDHLLKRERLTVEEAGSFLEQIASALQYAHDHGVIHRDVKPSNILLRPDGYAYLGDFGLAKAQRGAISLTHAGTMIGTPEYTAPEQSNGVNDYRSDIYSLGVILYQMLTGRVPFIADTPVAVTLKHLQTQPVPPGQVNPDIPSSIEAVVLKALAKDPDERFQQAIFFTAAYKKALRELQTRQENTTGVSTISLEAESDTETALRTTATAPAITRITPISEPCPPAPKVRFPFFPANKRRVSFPTFWGIYGWKQRLLLVLIAFLCLSLGLIVPLSLMQPASQTPKHPTPDHAATSTASRLQQQHSTATAQTLAEQQATLAAQAHVQATAGITSAIGAGKVLYRNEMTTAGGGWLNDGRQCSFSSQGYRVSTSAHAVAWCYFNQQLFANAIITAQGQLLHGDTYGLIFRLRPVSKSFYVIEINNRGEYRFVRAQGNDPSRWLTLIDWTPSRAIPKGYGHTNTFLIVARGSQFTVYMNRQLIISPFLDATYSSGLIGFLVGGDSSEGTAAVFSKLWIFQK
jgi:serine/threonine protein kinase